MMFTPLLSTKYNRKYYLYRFVDSVILLTVAGLNKALWLNDDDDDDDDDDTNKNRYYY